MEQLKNEIVPGISPRIRLSDLSEEEREICDYLAKKYWFITRFEKIKIAGSIYHTAFLKPTNEISIKFNLYREIVLIFSGYPEFMPRCLDVFDHFDVQELRLEEICCIIISKDSEIQQKIDHYLKSNKEEKVIIPFTYAELVNCNDSEFVINRFRTHFYQRDLFDLQDPLRKDLYFFGRSALIHELANKHLTTNNAGVFGLRKTGKTSILYGVERVLNKKETVFILFDCQDLHTLKWKIAVHHIISKLAEKCGVKQNKIHSREDYCDENNVISEIFLEDIKRIYRLNNKKSILLVFDEIEHITFDTSASKQWRSGDDFICFWQTIRSTYQKLQKDNIFTYLIAGTNPHCVEKSRINNVDNPIFAQFNPTYIEPFDYVQTKDMVQRLGGYMGLLFPDEICTHLNEDFGGHPLLIRQMCSFLHRQIYATTGQRPFKIDKSFYNSQKALFYENSSGFNKYAQMILDVLKTDYNDEYSMLEWLAKGDVDTFNGLADQDKSYISHLLQYGIISKNNANDGYSFRIEAIKDYLEKATKYQKINLNNEEKWAEINERRNRVEPQLRNFVRIHLKSRLGEEKAVEAIKSTLISSDKNNKDNIRRMSSPVYKDYFDPNKVNIFFLTLFNVIRANYEDCFRNLFDVDLDTFSNRTQLLNKYGRVDAHGKPIDDNDFERFRVDISWLEEKLKENS